MAGAKQKASNPRKLPEQDRSRATVTAIMEAAAHILVRYGYDAFTTNRVAERAGVSIGSLYQYFPNKEALLGELMRRHVGELEAGIDLMAQAAKTAPLEDVVRAAIDHNVRAHLIDPALHRVLSEEVPRLGKLDWQSEFSKRSAARVKAVLEDRRGELAIGDLDLAVYILTRTVEAIVHNAVSERLADLKSGAVTQELTRLLVGYLTGNATAPKRPVRAAAE